MVTIPTWSDAGIGPQWLDDPELGILPLDSAHGYFVQKLDLGFPAARRSSSDRIGAPGSVDRTRFHGGRTVALEVKVHPGTVAGFTTRRDCLSRLRAYARAGRSPVFYFDEEVDGTIRRVRLAGDTAGGAFEAPGGIAVTLQWVAPDGVVEAGDEVAVTISSVPPADPGRTYGRTYPLTYPLVSTAGAQAALNYGTEPVAPLLRLWGPCTGPILTNVETGARIVSKGLVLTADQFAEVDVREGTFRLNGRPGEPILSSFDLLATRAVWLPPGLSRLTYTATSFGPGARAEVFFRPAYV